MGVFSISVTGRAPGNSRSTRAGCKAAECLLLTGVSESHRVCCEPFSAGSDSELVHHTPGSCCCCWRHLVLVP